ncbi:ketopantoate reductase family protein [Arthrobacter mobilis]|uniref:2-dehydropantoate 2-reductase n=1 Tax=Arthrobacter mobilis TaxID=2724944 RepID=A0A7X6HDY1_9MICC|nr:ketopantoate reductase family protein [Arthrobacter mobilis]NKX54494.1 ketopantoate reductase family protein [Arthrobacter mobilis]
MRILIAGAGATGGYFGARLVQAGRDVTFLVRPRRAKELRGGLRIIGPGTEDETIPVKTVTAQELDTPYDLVIVAVKAGALENVVEQIAPAVGPGTMILPFLNGMAHLDLLTERYGAEHVLGGLVKVVTTVTEEGHIRQLKPMAMMAIGEQSGERTRRIEELYRELSVPGFELSLAPDIIASMWHKWAFITAAGVVTCLMRGPVGDIVACPGGEEFALAVIAEAEAVAAAAGYPVPGGEHAMSVRLLTEPGSVFTSSLYRDVAAGLPHEGEHILGRFAARAEALRVDAPLTGLALLQLRVHDRQGR